MHRRTLLQAGLVTLATAAYGPRALAETADRPAYGDWIPAESHDPDRPVLGTHTTLETAGTEFDGRYLEEPAPILALPLSGMLSTPAVLGGLFGYPFGEDLLQPTEDPTASAVTLVDDLVVFTGEFDPATFEAEYDDGFTTEDRSGYTHFQGEEAMTDELAYGVSEDTVVAALHPGEDREYDATELVADAFDRNDEGTGRLVDDEDGEWLLEATGSPDVAVVAWGLEEGLDISQEHTVNAPELSLDSPVVTEAGGLVSTARLGEEDPVARFAGIYPEGPPGEGTVEEDLLDGLEIPHEIDRGEQRLLVEAAIGERSY